MPYNIGNKITSPKHFIHKYFQIMSFFIINNYPDGTIIRKKFAQQFKTGIHHLQPLRMLQIILIMLKILARIVRRVDKYALHATRIKRQQRLQRIQIIPLNQQTATIRIAINALFDRLQNTIRHLPGRLDVVLAGQPVQRRHKSSVIFVTRLFKKFGFLLPDNFLHSLWQHCFVQGFCF